MKPYMNNEELIDELVIHKNINRETIPENIFNERGYTTLVSPYKRLICTNFDTMRQEYIYKENGDFAEYINLACTSNVLRNTSRHMLQKNYLKNSKIQIYHAMIIPNFLDYHLVYLVLKEFNTVIIFYN